MPRIGVFFFVALATGLKLLGAKSLIILAFDRHMLSLKVIQLPVVANVLWHLSAYFWYTLRILSYFPFPFRSQYSGSVCLVMMTYTSRIFCPNYNFVIHKQLVKYER